MRVFVCRRTKAELKKLGHHWERLKYIAVGRTAKVHDGQARRADVAAVALGLQTADRLVRAAQRTEIIQARSFWLKALRRQPISSDYCEMDLMPDKRLYFLDPSEGVGRSKLLSAVLNSSICGAVLWRSSAASNDGRWRVGSYASRTLATHLLFPVSSPDDRAPKRGNLRGLSTSFRQRPILRVSDEIKKRDRQAFDSAVL